MLDQIPAAPAGEARDGAPAMQERHAFTFHGRAGEYFGIWIVNVLLTILTLGIFSAWATVRTQRYFYANTTLAGAAFEYLADPIRILKGRLIAYAVVIALILSSQFLIGLYIVLIIGVWLLWPIVAWLALRFRARYSAWRGLRFGFDGTKGRAYGPFLGWPLAAAMTMFVLSPLARREQHKYMVNGHRFGSAPFAIDVREGPYFRAWGAAIGLAVACFVVGGAVAAGIVAVLPGGVESKAAAIMTAVFAVFYGGFFIALVLLRARYTNLMWNHTRVAGQRFESTLRTRPMLWIYFSNLVAIACTLGLATPWAMVRLARYRADHLVLVSEGGLDGFVAGLEADRASTGAELSDALDFGADISL